MLYFEPLLLGRARYETPTEQRSPQNVSGEHSWPTQPRPTKPKPFVRDQMTIDEVTDISPESHQEIPAIITLVDSSSSGSVGKDVYTQNCIACHGTDLKGGTAFGQVVPTLEGTSERKTSSEIDAVIRQGSASMPPFRHLTLSHMYHLLEYLEALSEELWRDKPPAGGYATPDVYAVNGKQYLVIACGSGRVTPEGDYYIAVTKMIERGFQGPAIS